MGAWSPRVGLTGSGLPSARRGVGWPREGAHRVDRDGGHLWDTSLVPTPSHLRGTGRCTSPPSLGQSGYWGHTDGQCQSWLSRFPGPTWVSCPLTAFPCAYPSFPLREDCRWTELLESLTPLLAKCIHHCRLPPSISRTFPDPCWWTCDPRGQSARVLHSLAGDSVCFMLCFLAETTLSPLCIVRCTNTHCVQTTDSYFSQFWS